MNTVIEIQHIIRDERGIAWISGANTKLLELIREHLAYGWSADELQEQHPHLTLGQIHAALAYFYDHPAEFEGQLRAEDDLCSRLRKATGESALQRRLRALARQQ